DEGQGNVAADGSGNGHLATLHGARWTEGKRGKALEFDGTSAYCDLGNAPGLSFKQGEDVTVALWVKTDDAWGSILILRRKEDGGSAVCLAVEDGRLVGIIREDGGEARGPALIRSQQAVNDGRWHHVLLSRDASADAVSLYLDGEGIGSMEARQLGAAGPITTNLRALGCERYWLMRGQQNADRQHLRGSIDEVCVYGRQLGKAEREALLAAEPPGSR